MSFKLFIIVRITIVKDNCLSFHFSVILFLFDGSYVNQAFCISFINNTAFI